ncbi:MAG: hypothetical protein ACM30I_00915 [Gemmatimonas sp.]
MAKTRKSRTLLAAKNAVRGALSNDTDISKVLQTQFSRVPASEFRPLFRWLQSFPSKRLHLYPAQRIEKYDQLYPNIFATPAGITGLIAWMLQLINDRSGDLTAYRLLADDFESQWLSQNIEAAEGTLSEIRKNFGFSLWWIEASLGFLAKTRGLEAQKEFARTVHEEAPNSAAAFFAHYVSARNEENVSLARFNTRVERVIDRQRIPHELKSYFKFVMIGVIGKGDDIPHHIGGCAVSISYIDAYEAFISILDHLVSERLHEEHWPQIATLLEQCTVDDWLIKTFRAAFSGRLDDREVRSAEAEELLLRGAFREAAAASSKVLSATTLSLETLATFSAAHAFGGGEAELDALSPLLREVARPLIVVFTRRSGMANAVADLAKTFLNLRPLKSLRAVNGHFLREWDEIRLAGLSSASKVFLYSKSLSPLHAFAVSQTLGDQIIARCAETAAAPVAKLIGALLRGDQSSLDGLHPFLGAEYAALGALFRSDLHAAATHSESLLSSPDELWRRRAARLTVSTLVHGDEFDRAIRCISSFCCMEDELRFFLPLKQVIQGKRWRELKHLKNEIALPIVLDLYIRTASDNDQETNRRIAYEEFLLTHNVMRPSELPVNGFPLPELTYFFSRVCIPAVMDISFRTFKNSREVEEERMRVCSRLADIDPKNSAIYNEEIRDRTKLLSIEDGLRDIDRSRVHINLDALVAWAENELHDSFKRYMALADAGLGYASGEVFEAAIRLSLEGKPDAAEQFLNYPQDEGAALLLDITDTFEQEYLKNPDYGLDAFLSMRIRHGSLAGHIRGPVEDAHLITTFNADTKSYAENTYWMDQLGDLTTAEGTALQRALRDFSAQYDKIIEELIKDKLQIQTSAKPSGLFVFEEHPIWMHYLRSRISAETTFDDFMQSLLFVANFKLEKTLSKVHGYVATEIKQKAEEAFDRLRTELEASLNMLAYARMNEAIANVSPEVQAAIGRVADWFVSVRRKAAETYRTVDQIIDVAIAATRSACRGFNPEIQRDVEDLGLLAPEVLSDLTDILFIVLGNVYEHSGIRPSPKITIRVRGVDYNGDAGRKLVDLRVESEIAEGVHTPEAVAKLKRIRGLMETGQYRQRVNLEGGSGLLKLKRTVSSDPQQQLDFGFTTDHRFFVHVKIALVYTAEPEGWEAVQ